MLEEGIYTLLANSTAVTDQLGTARVDQTTGIFPGLIKAGSDLPALVYLQVHGEEMQTFDGRGELRSARVQLSAYGDAYGDAKRTAKAVKDTLIGFAGTLDDGTEVDSIHLVSEMDNFVKTPTPTQETGGRSLYHTAIDVEIWYREAS
ncbi:MAG TPA: DUF3168 domain-containing protein [Chloroflexota bacterium]|nr:DUF3168 domain-containing protein [Chloroflexota bacterium]